MTAFSFTVTRLGDLTGTSTVNWAVSGNGPNPANAADFQGGVFPSGTVEFAPGQSSVTVQINIAPDSVIEPDEGFKVVISGATGGVLGTSVAEGTILNDDFADGNRPSPVDPNWGERFWRHFPTLNAISLNAGTTDLGIAADTGEYKMGHWRDRGGGAGGGSFTAPGVKGYGYDVFIDGMLHSLLPAEYVMERPTGEVSVDPGVGIEIWSRPNTGPESKAAFEAIPNAPTAEATAAGTELWASGLLTTYRKVEAAPPFARATFFIPRNTYAERAFMAPLWSVEAGNRAYPNDVDHKPFEYDDGEIIENGEIFRVSIHAFDTGGTAINTALGTYNPGAYIGRLVGILTIFDLDKVRTFYNVDGGAWTLVSTKLVSAMQTGGYVAEYQQSMIGFIHNMAAGFPWLGAAGVPAGPVHFHLVADGLWAHASNTSVVCPSGAGVPECGFAFRSAYDTVGIAETAPGGSTLGQVVGDITRPAGVVGTSIITYGGRLSSAGDTVAIAGGGLDYEGEPVKKFAIQGFTADGRKSIGRIYSMPVLDVAEAPWHNPDSMIHVQYAQNRAWMNGSLVPIAAVHNAAGVLTAGALALFNSAAWVLYMSGSNNPNFDGLYGNDLDRFLLCWQGATTPKKISTKVAGGTDVFADVAGMSTGLEKWGVAMSVAAAGRKACASVTGSPVIASEAAAKSAGASIGAVWHTGYLDEAYDAADGGDTTAGLKSELMLIAPQFVGGSAGALLSDAALRAMAVPSAF